MTSRHPPGTEANGKLEELPIAERIAHQRWLIERRSQIQSHLLEIQEEHQRSQDADWSILGFALGAAFSLWRAVFLVRPDRKVSHSYAGAQKLLHFLIEDGATDSPHDKCAQVWMAGYYLASAALRLNSISDMPEARRVADDREMDRLKVLSPLQEPQLGVLGETEYWDVLVAALATTVSIAKRQRSGA